MRNIIRTLVASATVALSAIALAGPAAAGAQQSFTGELVSINTKSDTVAIRTADGKLKRLSYRNINFRGFSLYFDYERDEPSGEPGDNDCDMYYENYDAPGEGDFERVASTILAGGAGQDAVVSFDKQAGLDQVYVEIDTCDFDGVQDTLVYSLG